MSADVQGAPWSGTAVYRRSLPTSHIIRQQTETSIRHTRRPRGLLLATHFGTRAFAVASSKAWNQLPAHLRALETDYPFKTALDNLYSTQCLLQIVWTRLFHRRPCNDFHMLRRVSNPQRYYYYYYYRVADCSVLIVLLSVVLCVCIFLHFTLKPRPHWRVVENGDFSATISANSITLIYCGCFFVPTSRTDASPRLLC